MTHRNNLKRFLFLSLFLLALLPGFAAAAGYTLGSGDIVKISVYAQPDLNTEAQITDKGTINFPLIGEIKIGGLEKGAAEAFISNKLVNERFLKNPQVNLLIVQYRSQRVSVLGFVQKPGKYPIDGTSYVTDLIAQAGGIAADGADSATFISRDENQKVVKKNINLIRLFDSQDMTQNYQVQDGDIIHVSRAPVFYIYGEVQRPGAFRLQPNMTIMQAISVGGGLTARGTERGLKVKRTDLEGNVETLSANGESAVKANDVIYVKQRLF